MDEVYQIPRPESGEPTWEIAHLFPAQGEWSEEDYFNLPCGRLVEYTDGSLEVLPELTLLHRSIVSYLHHELLAFVESMNLGSALVAPLPIQLQSGTYREPDLVFMLAEHSGKRHDLYWEPPDLVMEVVLPENRSYDLEVKRREYAQAGIPEYWLVDLMERKVSVLNLSSDYYSERGAYQKGKAHSNLLPGFEIDVDELWQSTNL